MELPEPLILDDEHGHTIDPDDELWNESWYLDWVTDDGGLGGYLRWSAYPGLGVGWFWACVVGEGRPLVTAINHGVALPTSDVSLTAQAEGLRCDLAVEEPFERVRVGYETTATRHADPAAVFGDEIGEPAVLTADLTWETAGGVYPYPGVTRYEVPCTVSGEVRVDDEVYRVETHGERDHSWGHRDWWNFGWVWTSGRLDDGTMFHATQVRIPGIEYQPGFVVAPGGALTGIEGFAAEEATGEHGIPTSATMGLDRMSLGVTPVAHAPLPLEAPDGRVGHLQRALCRFDTTDGRAGYGWTEWNQPPPN